MQSNGWRVRTWCACAVAFTVTAAGACAAAEPVRGLELSLLGGSAKYGQHLADYQWEVSPRFAWGASATWGAPALAAGVRASRTQTRQHSGLAGGPDPAVLATSLELLGRVRVARAGRAQIDALASAGRLYLGYAPDHVSVSDGAGGVIAVNFTPIHEWTGGAGLAFRLPLRNGWSTGIEIERSYFGLQTAHRNGIVIQVGRESFGEWSAQLVLARFVGRR